MTHMDEAFLHGFSALGGLGVDGVAFGEDDSCKLDQEVLEADKIEILGSLLLIQQFDVDVADQVLHLRVVGQEEQLVVLQELYHLHHADCFFPCLVVLEVPHALYRVHRG